MPDASLKSAMEEIKPILRKYDCAGLVILQSQTHMEYYQHMDPTWSAVSYTNRPGGDIEIRFRVKEAEQPSKAAARKLHEDTIGLFFGLKDVLVRVIEQTDLILLKYAKAYKGEATHWSRFEGGTKANEGPAI